MKIKLGFLIFGLLLSATTILALKTLAPSSWNTWKPATCIAEGCFCEEVEITSPIRQPANTWSSLAFILSGCLVLASTHISHKHMPSSALSWRYGSLLGVSAVIIGIGSAFFHASLTLVGQFFDVFGMYLLASFMLAYAAKRFFGWGHLVTAAFYILLTTTLSLLLFFVPDTRRYIFALVMVVAIAIEVAVRRLRGTLVEVRWWNAGFLLFAGAYVIWILDNRKILCNPYSWLQGHAIWHMLGAAAVILLYRYYASEQSRVPAG